MINAAFLVVKLSPAGEALLCGFRFGFFRIGHGFAADVNRVQAGSVRQVHAAVGEGWRAVDRAKFDRVFFVQHFRLFFRSLEDC